MQQFTGKLLLAKYQSNRIFNATVPYYFINLPNFQLSLQLNPLSNENSTTILQLYRISPKISSRKANLWSNCLPNQNGHHLAVFDKTVVFIRKIGRLIT